MPANWKQRGIFIFSMNTDSLGFILEYQDRNIYCEVFVDDGHFMVLFDSEYECEVEMDETPVWIQSDGDHLPEAIIREVGLQIEKKYG